MTADLLTHQHVCCALCGADDTTHVLDLRDPHCHCVYQGEQPVPVAGSETLVCCRRCGLVYIDPQPRVLQPYATYPPSTEAAYFAARREAHQIGTLALLDLLQTHLSPGPQRLLDVGCGDGVLLRAAQARGWQIRGLDSSSTLVTRLDEGELLGKVSLGRAEELTEQDAIYDIVTMVNLLEHVWDPAAVLHGAASALRAGGLLAVHVPNYGWGRRFGRHWHQLEPLDHLTYFTSDTLSQMLRQHGLEPITRFSLPGNVSWRRRLQHTLNRLGLWPGSGLGLLARRI